MKIKILLTTFVLTILTFCNKTIAQSVTQLPGETVPINYSAVFNGDGNYNSTTCYFNKAKGMIFLAIEVQKDNLASWPESRVALYYGGSWRSIFQLWTSTPNTFTSNSSWDVNRYSTAGVYAVHPTLSNATKITEFNTSGGAGSSYLINSGNLNRYNGNYLPLTGDVINRTNVSHYSNFSIQTIPFSASYNYPVHNPALASGVQAVTVGADKDHANQNIGNLPGVGAYEPAGGRGVVYICLSNLPPDMLESGNFRVHLYQNANTAHDRIYEWVYNNQNFMTNAPLSLTASNNKCGMVTLNWGNASNTMPTDGTMDLKTVIFRDGNYLAMVNGNVSTYNDVTAAQNVTYQYSLKHVAWSESYHTYFRSPSCSNVSGNVKPSPDEPISPSASIDKCNNKIDVNWSYNGVNPDKFRIDYSTVSTGPFATLTSTLSGGTRSFSHTGVTRGIQYYYRIYAISSCSVLSTTYATCNGISPADPPMATSVTAISNTVTNTVDLTWTDNANNETKYQIVRTDDEGNTVLTDVNPNQTTYNDASAAACRLYTYKIRVFNDCVLSGIVSTSQATVTLPPPNLGGTFDATHKLTTSKGYFSNRVELNWGNNNGVNIDLFKIYRKQLGTSLDSVQIATAPTGSALYVDNTADARVFYRYTIVGVKQCNGSDLLTNITSDVGFRNPTGLVSGHIEYNGGVAVNGAKVFVQQSGSTIAGNSLNFSPGGTLVINDGVKLEPGAQMRCEFWIKPKTLPTGNILNKNNAFSFSYNGTNWVSSIFTSGTQKTISIPSVSLTVSNWNHIAMVYNGTSFKTFVNGIFSGSVSATGNVDDTGNNLVFGSSTSNFYLDEFRLIGQSDADSVITTDANRILNGDETGFKCNLHFNEAVGISAYDVSKVGNVYNANHAAITNTNVTWSNDIPTTSQLGYFGVTNNLGNYIVSGIQYLGTGENFNLVPQYQTHSFSPNSRAVYIGDGSSVYNNQDFIDISSFPFTGTLFYKNTTCPVPDALLNIDGLPVVVNGQQAKTDAAGTFSISVPIGHHFVDVYKFGHNMEIGRYPATSTHNFQAPVSGVTFVDSTKVKIVGRVVGGLIQAEKAPGMGRSINNIGKAYVSLATPLTGSPCFTTAVITNSATGEYEFNVPPLAYKIVDAYVMTNSITISKSNLTNTSQVLDLTTLVVKTKVKDTLRDSFGGIVSIDSIEYNKRHDMIYRSTPLIDVSRLDNTKLIGDDTISMGATKIPLKPILTNTATLGAYGWGPFDWPIFTQNKTYSVKIRANEVYTNYDSSPVVDSVALKGNMSITNDMVDGADPNANFSFVNGTATYSFVCGSPNINANTTTPTLSYVKDMQIVVVPNGAASISWQPNTMLTNKNYHAIVVGKVITGTGLATQGPERVDFILRDPPGSGSSASWSTGTSRTIVESLQAGSEGGVNLSNKIYLGVKVATGIGVSIENDQHNEIEVGLNTSRSNSFGTTNTDVITSSYAVSTRDDADNVGADADVFVGRSRNWYVGPTADVELIDASKCAGYCFGPIISGKRLSRLVGYAVAPGETKTRFSYTQNEIETVVIPTLISLRNQKLQTSPLHTTTVSVTHPGYGSNNDDIIWGAPSATNNPAYYDAQDTTGASYTFHGYLKAKNDTVRTLNQQIALWKQTLAQNEREKLNCKNNAAGTSLIDNFTLGSAVVTNAYSSDATTEEFHDWDIDIEETLTAAVGFNIGGSGLIVAPTIHVRETKSGTSSQATTTSNSIEYTLTDGDPGDIMSIDVYKLGSGNVFITRGGQTMCPYEDAVVCHYYNPTDPNAYIGSTTYNETGFATIANATVQREMPNISITPAVQLNIPSSQAAVYQLNLSNQSPLTVNNDIDLQVRVASVSNPNGAVLKIDGQNANTIINIPSGGSVIKTLTIERGPIEIDYDSLMVIFSSACSEDIADTAYVTVHFIPTCTDLEITAPVNNFVINNSNNSLANIIMENYNYNYGDVANTTQVATGTYTYIATSTNTLTGVTSTAVATGTNYASVPVAAHPNYGFEKIGFEFKPSNTSTWLQVQDFYKSPTAATAAGASTLYPIPNGQVYTPYTWTVSPNSYADGNYEIRAKSYCYNKDGSYAVVYSPVLQGVMDRVNPAPFGTPSPGDGILDPNDDISIQFNEPIDISSLNYAPISNPGSTFDIRGVLNGTALRHSESLNFDGTADYAEVTGGASLQKRSFTFEFWAKFNPTGTEQTVISQGTDAIQKMTIGFSAANELKFTLGSQIALSTNPVTLPTDWHHYAVVYDYPNSDASLFIDGVLAGTNNNFLVDYLGTGKLTFGKALPANNNFLNGNTHEIRLWSKARTISEITVTMNKILSRNQSGLVYNWKMDEATGSVASDDIRSRNANIYGATWEVNPNGNAVQLTSASNDNIKVSSGNIAINKEMDFTLEFWFNSTQSGVSTLFSNGEGIATSADSVNAWTIQKDAAGAIHVYHKGLNFIASTTNYFDGSWHHFALVMQRTGNLSAYVDGNLQNSMQGINFDNLAGSSMYLGAKAVVAGSITTLSDYFDGKLDEFRLWNTARKAEQVKRDKQNRMLGNEHGLMAYLPFENYIVVAGTPSLTPTFNNQSLETLTVTAQGSTTLIAQTPTIKLPRPIQSVNYTWSLNNDKIILTTNTSPDQLENVTLDITVKNALDMHGNKMQSPKTWIAYINKNQVKWQDNEFNFEKTVDSVITFVAPIVNSGGAQKAFTIDGLPSWMTANITSGTIAPNSVQNVTFTIPAGGSIGEYDAEVSVTTDFNFAEILRVNLKVKGTSPTWTVNPANFNYSMNIFGQLKIDNVIATNPENKIAAFNNGVICGVANLQYLPAYDRYEVFLNVYSNQITGDSIRFNIYDAESGLTFVNVTPSLMFVDNDIVGTVTSPITFVANTEIARNIPLNAGWTWVSFPLKSNKLLTSNSLMTSINPSNGDISTGITDYDQYDASMGWIGNISSNGGYKNNQSYKIKKAIADTLVHIGMRLNPDSAQAQINVVPGWNWIGYVSNKNVSVSEALGNYNAITGDLIKSQYEFAYYDNLVGWTGSLTQMKPTLGYMLKSTGTSTFSYPLSTFIGKMANQTDNNVNEVSQNIFPFTPEQYSNTMSAIITGNLCDDALDNGNIAIGAFDNTNTLRGYAYPTLVNNDYKFFLTVYSNGDGENLNIKYFNTTDGFVAPTNTVIAFATDALVGTPSTPFVADVADSLACRVVEITTSVNQIENSDAVSIYPNPFEDNLTLTFNKAINAKVELLDVLGKVVYSSTIKDKKEFNMTFDRTKTNIASGMYYIRLTGDVNQQIKVIKTK